MNQKDICLRGKLKQAYSRRITFDIYLNIYKNTSVRFCSMPKLSYEKIEERKTGIEDAAKELLIKQGFHATSMRDIAKSADISLGNVYNYFETKEAIFESIINRYLVVVDQKIKDILDELDEPLDPKDMRRLGEMIGEMVDQHQDFWLLMYIDVLEFQNRHFRKMFEGLAEKFRRLFEEKFASAIERGDLRSGVDPAIGFTKFLAVSVPQNKQVDVGIVECKFPALGKRLHVAVD